MGRKGSTGHCLQQAASGLRPAAVAPAAASDVEAPETRRVALHGHG
ncbi:hypothetical protein PV721_01920 [Streptomyces sp. MB09-01]|nr:hypothetical protein [Streptomyces sp. MB09-01]MDX3533142.1 hypothetical protein [Streptomyces sp. MB09-01]